MAKIVLAMLVGFNVFPFEICAAAARAFFADCLEEVHDVL